MTLDEILSFSNHPDYMTDKVGRVTIIHSVFLDGYDGVIDLPKGLIGVEGTLSMRRCRVRSLRGLKRVGYNLDLTGCKELVSLGSLEVAQNALYLERSSVRDLGKLVHTEALHIRDLPLIRADHASACNLVYAGAETGTPMGREFYLGFNGYRKWLRAHPDDAPLFLAKAEYAWQRALCEESLAGRLS